MKSRFKVSASRFIGYKDDPRNAHGKKGEAYLTSPSSNCRLTLGGEAMTRAGYEDSLIDLSSTGACRPFHMAEYDLTFFAAGTGIYYTEGDILSTSTVYNTGITITQGQAKYTRFEEAMGCVYAGNKVDGWHLIMVTRVNGSVSLGGATVITDKDGAARANAFDTELSPAHKYLRMNGTDEEYTGINTGAGSFTGLSLTQGYADNTIALIVYDITSVFPKCSKVAYSASKGNAVYFIGISADDTVLSLDAAPYSVGFTDWITATTIENMVSTTGGVASSEPVGRGGELVNIVVTDSYIYLFKKNSVAYISISNINSTTGARPPDEFDSVNHGCINEDCAASIGNGAIVFATPGKRVVAIRTRVVDGSISLFPDESFDQDIRNTLKLMDDDQSNSHMFYHTGERLLYFQCSINGEQITLVYDNNIGKWLPPDTNKTFSAYTERKGVLFAGGATDDSIYRINSSNTDDGQAIDCKMAHGLYDIGGTGKWDEVNLTGSITQDTNVLVETIVDASTSSDKYITSSSYSFAGGRSFSDIAIGNNVYGGASVQEQLADYINKRFAVAPLVYGRQYQTVLSSSGAFTWRGYEIRAKAFSTSLSTLS